MRWDDFRRSDNIEDDRDSDGGGYGGGGGGFGIPMGGGGLGIGGVIVLGLIGWALGIDPGILIGAGQILTGGGGGGGYQQPYTPSRSPARTGAPTDQSGQFVAAVLGDTEDTWQVIFAENGRQYRPPKLVLFRGQIQGGCGFAQAAMGPFYCPRDRRIYLDTSFFQQIENRFRGCSGNACKFSQAYVIAHEVGHHVQMLFGIMDRAHNAQQQTGGDQAAINRIQVRIELQADCYAGMWAKRSEQRRSFLDPGDIDAALQTATAIGDDTLQRQARGRVVPDSFTHGSAEQRKRWFSTGFQQGTFAACDTFKAGSP